MGEYLKVEGHQDLVRDTRTGAILNKNKTAYLSYKKRVQEAQRQRDEIRNATREINNIKSEMHEIKSLLKELVSKE
jgi:hypothetical protein